MNKLTHICIAVFALVATNAMSQVCFSSASNFAAGPAPWNVDHADFNGDGKMDLAAANFSSDNHISVLLGNGLGGFSAASTFLVGSAPASITSADFNGDGKMDLAVANHTSNNVSVLIGNGLGSFSSATNFSVGTNPNGITSSDFNGDGILDLATANFSSSNVSVLMGNGLGSFSAAINFSVGLSPGTIINADFNGDGNMDIATDGANVYVLLGNGLGSFSAFNTFAIEGGAYSIISDDFNGDSKTDLAVAAKTSNNVSMFMGDGLGSFATATNFAVGTGPESLINADFNGDGKTDLATANYTSNNVSVLTGNGLGGFSSATNFSVGINPISIISADFNGDSKMDLVTTNSISSNVSVLLNNIPIVTASIVGATITANQNGATYQWIDCNNGNTPIAGQTNQSFTATVSGNYSVIVTQNNCSDTSSCYSISNVINCDNNTAISPQTISLTTGGTATFTATTSDPNPSYVWQSNFGQGFQTLNNFGEYSGVNTATLNIANVQLSEHNQPFRVISTSGECVDTSNVAFITISDTCINFINDTSFVTVTDTLIINTLITGINPPNNTNTINVFPNPANSHITIDYGNFSIMNGYQLKIENSLGQEVFQTNITQQSDYLNLNTWGGNGLYFVHIIDPQGNTIDIRKIVLQ